MTTRGLVLALGLTATACGGGGMTSPTPPTGSGFLAGTWTGTMVVARRNQPLETVTTTWVFQEMPLTAGTMFSATVTYGAGWLPPLQNPITASVVPPEPGQHFSVNGDFAACFAGTFGARGTAERTTITANIGGINCVAQFPDYSVFDGSLTLTKQGR